MKPEIILFAGSHGQIVTSEKVASGDGLARIALLNGGKLYGMGHADYDGDYSPLLGYEGRTLKQDSPARIEARNNRAAAMEKLVAMRARSAGTVSTPSTVTSTATASTVSAPSEPSAIELAIANAIAGIAVETISAQVIPSLDEHIKDVYGLLPKRIEIATATSSHVFTKTVHKRLERVMTYLTNGANVWLVGEAGTGKNVLVEDIAAVLAKPYFYMNAITDEFALRGFMNALGEYTNTTEFLEFCENGGICFIDEIDQSIPEILKQINAALANRYFSFPHKGRVELHPDCMFVVAANTRGTGGDEHYQGFKMDGSSINRFVMVDVGYDENIELECAQGDTEMVSFLQEWRRAAKECGTAVIASYRQLNMLAKFKDIIPLDELLCEAVHPTLEGDDVRVIRRAMKGMANNRYANALAA